MMKNKSLNCRVGLDLILPVMKSLHIKRLAADLIDLIDSIDEPFVNDEVRRLQSGAITEIETAAMYGVKAAVKAAPPKPPKPID